MQYWNKRVGCKLWAATLTLLAMGYGPWAYTAELTIEKPWARATVSGQTTSAAYAIMENKGAEPVRIIGAESPFASRTELHAHQKHENGSMEMIHLESMTIPANSTAVFKPMSYHVMFFGLKNPLKIGMEIPVTLFYADDTQQTFRAPIKPLSHHDSAMKDHQHD